MGKDARSKRHKRGAAIVASLLGLASAALADTALPRPVRVGFYESPPLVYSIGPGRPGGLFIDLLEDIAAKENWQLAYVHGDWRLNLHRLTSGQIDLLMIATPGSPPALDINREPVLSTWLQVYAAPGAKIHAFPDLKDRRVAIHWGDYNNIELTRYADKFNIDLSYLRVADVETMFDQLQRGVVQAAICEHITGGHYAEKFGVTETPIMLFPGPLGFGTAAGRNKDLLDAIDRYLKTARAVPDSQLNGILNKWLTRKLPWRLGIYELWIMLGLSGIIGFLAIVTLVLRWQVRIRTRDLMRQNSEFQAEIARRKEIESQLMLNSALLSIQQEASIDGILVVADDNRILSWNTRFTEMWGLPRELMELRRDEPVRQSVMTKLADPEEFLRQIQDLYQHPHKTNRDEILLQDGRIFDRYTASLFGADGQYYGRAWFFRDITENKRILAELRRANEIQSLILNNTAVGIAFVRNRIFEWVNPVVPAMLGLPTDRVVGASTRILFQSEQEYDTIGQSGYEALARNEWFDFEMTAHRADGTTFAGRMIGKALDPTQAQGGSIWIIENVTERKKAIRSLEESEERYRQLADNVQEIFWIIDLERQQILYVNKAYETITGLARDELLRDRASWLRLIHPDDRDITASMYGENVNVEFRIIRPDGKTRWLRVRSYPIRNARGDVYRIAGLGSDITDFKLASEREQLHRQHLMQTEKMASLGTLAAGMAHEINNPNMFIMLNVPLIKDLWNDLMSELEAHLVDRAAARIGTTPLPDVKAMAEELFSGIQQGSERIKNIVTELKNYAREKPNDASEAVDINAVCRAAVTLTRNRIKNATDHFQTAWAEKLPAVQGSTQRLEQVAINLLMNACEALTDKSQAIEIATQYRPEANTVDIRIADRGCGMSPDILARIKDPFFTTKRDNGGTGLGVSITAKILDEHGGSMVYDSQPGHGTTVTVTLPAMRQENDS